MQVRMVGLLSILVLGLGGNMGNAQDTWVEQMAASAGIPSTETRRGQLDIIGYASTEEQIEEILRQGRAAGHECMLQNAARNHWDESTRFIAAVHPHDDHYYTGRLNTLWMPYLRAKRVILFGVSHGARRFDMRNKLVFDAFDEWHGPYGPVPVSSLHDELLARLPEEDRVVNNDMHIVEHSIEAILPFLQANNPDVEIVPVLVPLMDVETMERLAEHFATALSELCEENDWSPGDDIALMISADGVHYGDSQFGGSGNVDFGMDADGYIQATNRDRMLIHDYMCGIVTPAKLREFLYTCVEENDVSAYKITWCGRFSIPFGLLVADRITESLLTMQLEGFQLDYSTSVEEASLDLTAVGLGTTSPNNLHHWVGYPVIGYVAKQD